MSKTISAIATANGISSISIIRLSGEDSLGIAKKITKRASLDVRVAHLSSLYNHKDELIDQAIVIYL